MVKPWDKGVQLKTQKRTERGRSVSMASTWVVHPIPSQFQRIISHQYYEKSLEKKQKKRSHQQHALPETGSGSVFWRKE
jgi:hypothetical protein